MKIRMNLVFYKANTLVYQKNWDLPQLKHLYKTRCESKGPLLLLHLQPNLSLRAGIWNFKSVKMTEKQSGKLLYQIDNIPQEILGIDNPSIKLQDDICIVRRVTAAEEAVTISGVYLVEDRHKSSRDKRVFEEVEFSSSQTLAIVEDSLDVSIN